MLVPNWNGEIRARVVTNMNVGPWNWGFSFVCIGRFVFLQKKNNWIGEAIVVERKDKREWDGPEWDDKCGRRRGAERSRLCEKPLAIARSEARTIRSRPLPITEELGWEEALKVESLIKSKLLKIIMCPKLLIYIFYYPMVSTFLVELILAGPKESQINTPIAPSW